VILLRPKIVAGGRLLWEVVARYNGEERVISPPLSKERAVKVMAWAASRPASTVLKAG
jgi:hypothetical protein